MIGNNDKQYWNEFYKNKNEKILENSKFAEFVYDNWIHEKKRLIEYGCGNGRDALFFSAKGLTVTAVDTSETAIEQLNKKQCNCSFLCDDFVESSSIYKCNYDVCYSRFTLHAICLEDEKKLIRKSYRVLSDDGIFCIEVRSIHDALYGRGTCLGRDEYFFDGHYRRFIRMNELLERLMYEGFTIKYAEENVDFSPLEDDNPKLIRVIAEKENSTSAF